jgi:hypothetical protein
VTGLAVTLQDSVLIVVQADSANAISVGPNGLLPIDIRAERPEGIKHVRRGAFATPALESGATPPVVGWSDIWIFDVAIDSTAAAAPIATDGAPFVT